MSRSSSQTPTPATTWVNHTTSPPPLRYSGLSTGLKAAIGTGVTFVLLLFAGFGAFMFWYCKRLARRKKASAERTPDNAGIVAIKYPKEMEDTSVPPYDIGDFDWARRRGAVELESPVCPKQTVDDRAELEALRKKSIAPVELEA